MSKIMVTLCITAVTAFAGIAHAGGGGCGEEQFGNHEQHNFKKIGKELGLTDAQKAQAKTLFQGNRDVLKPLITSLQTERKNLRTLTQADSVDETAIRAEMAKLAVIQADLAVNRAKTGAQFRAILTPAQQTMLKTLQEKREAAQQKMRRHEE
jgi:protein CpxP